MRYLLLFIILNLCSNQNIAQSPVTEFDSYSAVGFLAGKSPVSFTAQTVNGIRIGTWYVGVGIGIDEYAVPTLPLFLDLKKEFTIKNTKFFVYGDAGTHFIKKDKVVDLFFGTEERKAKLYLEAGVGIKLKTSGSTNIFADIGNSYKTVEFTESPYPDTGATYSYEKLQRYSRISVRLGFQF